MGVGLGPGRGLPGSVPRPSAVAVAPSPHPHHGLVTAALRGDAVGCGPGPAGCLSRRGSAVPLGRGVSPAAAAPAQTSALWFSRCLPSNHNTRWGLSHPGRRAGRLRGAAGRPRVTQQRYRQPGAPGPQPPPSPPLCPNMGVGVGVGAGRAQLLPVSLQLRFHVLSKDRVG